MAWRLVGDGTEDAHYEQYDPDAPNPVDPQLGIARVLDKNITTGLRGDAGGENARWSVNPKTGREEPVIGGYLYSDLLRVLGSPEAIRNYGANPNAFVPDGDTQGYATQGPFAQDMDIFGARPSNDTFSGKDGLRDLGSIALMAAPVGLGAAGAFGAAGSVGSAGATAGTAAFEAGAGTAGLGAAGTAAGGEAALGSGLTPSSGAGATLGSGTAGSTLGSGLNATLATEGIGGGATGTGVSSGLAGAGSALTPGYFAAEGVGGAGGAPAGGGGGTGGGSSLAPTGAVDYLGMAIRGLPGVLGAISSNNQSRNSSALAQQYMNLGAPSRARFEASYAPGFTMENDPGYRDALNQAAKATLHNLSIGGNPAGSPNAWAKSMQDLYQNNAYSALQNYRSMNGSAGGLSGALQASQAPAVNAITQQGNVAGALGGAAADIFTPRKSLSDILREIGRAGY